MNRVTSVLESFPAEHRLAARENMPEFRSSYDRVRGFLERVELEARLREASAQGWITLPSRRRRRPNPIPLPGRPISELLNEVRD
jgi:hypothetical protein